MKRSFNLTGHKNINFILGFIILFFLTFVVNPANAQAINWKEVKPTNLGRQWIDINNMQFLENNKVIVNTKYQAQNAKNKSAETIDFLYEMEINCKEKIFRDKSINGVNIDNKNWRKDEGDVLIQRVIELSCSNKSLK